jgi:predicted hydrocarbon binding protein
VSQAQEPFSPTYCQCSCGWYRQLFETLQGKAVEVDLLGSIRQGDERCQFLIRTDP